MNHIEMIYKMNDIAQLIVMSSDDEIAVFFNFFYEQLKRPIGQGSVYGRFLAVNMSKHLTHEGRTVMRAIGDCSLGDVIDQKDNHHEPTCK